MTPEKKIFRADARVLHEKASGGELRRKKKNVFFSSLFFDFPKRGLPWKALKLQGIFVALKNRFLSRLSKNEIAVENIGKSKVNIENFEKLKNRKISKISPAISENFGKFRKSHRPEYFLTNSSIFPAEIFPENL